MKERKRKEETIAVKQVGSSPTWDILYLGAIQWPWSLAPTWGLILNSLGQIVDNFSGHFMLETVFLCRLNLMYVIHAYWIFFVVVILAAKKKNWKKNLVCVCFILV